MQAEPGQDEAPAQVANALASESEAKVKKAPTGARVRSIKTPLQREALEAAYLSKLCSLDLRNPCCCSKLLEFLMHTNLYLEMQLINSQQRKCGEL